MEVVNLSIDSKNKQTLQKVFALFNKKNDLYKTTKNLGCKTKKTLISILKSPHVNKKAQEQFEFKSLKNKIVSYSTKKSVFSMFLKKIIFKTLSDVRCKTTFNFKIIFFRKKFLLFFNPDNKYESLNVKKYFVKKQLSNCLTNLLKQRHVTTQRRVFLRKSCKSSLVVFDLFGESSSLLKFSKHGLDSSVGVEQQSSKLTIICSSPIECVK